MVLVDVIADPLNEDEVLLIFQDAGAARELVARGLAVWSEDGSRRPVLIVRGQANLIDQAAAVEILQSWLDGRKNYLKEN